MMKKTPYLVCEFLAAAVLVGLVFNQATPGPSAVTLAKYQNRAFKNPFIKTYNGPFNATVLRVLDADTVSVRVYPWPSIAVETKVRLRGLDTPEKRRYKCVKERELAKLADSYVNSVLKPGQRVQLSDVSFGKYANRVISDLMIETVNDQWASIGETLIAAGYAKTYEGGKKPSWC